MNRGRIITGIVAALLAVPALSQSAPVRSVQPPPHTTSYPELATGMTEGERRKSYELSPELHRGISAAAMRAQAERLEGALAALAPQKPGTPDTYVVSVALDSDPVFAREAREAGRVLAARYSAQGRTLTLAGPDGVSDDLPQGSITALLRTLHHLGTVMDGREDVLVLYTTSHGADIGLAYHYGDTGFGILSPKTLKATLEEAGIARRVLILSACYSGVFVPVLASNDTAILTAAASTRTSFGCQAENDWTYFGDALINRALRQPVGLEEASRLAGLSVAEWEMKSRVIASLPQTFIGEGAKTWLPAIEAGMPKQPGKPVGRPAAP